MGKITDIVVAVFVFIIGIFVLYRLGITLPMLEHMIRGFFAPSKPATNATTGSLIFGVASSAKERRKAHHKIEEIMRIRYLRALLKFKRRD